MTGATETEARTPAVTAWGWRAYAIAAVVLVLDQLSKAWIISTLPVGATVEVFWPLQFTRIWNEGVSFGMFQAEHDLVRFLVAPMGELAPLAHNKKTALRQHTNRRGVVARGTSVKRPACLQLQELLEGTRGNAAAPIFTADPIGDLAVTLQVEARDVTHNSTVDLVV